MTEHKLVTGEPADLLLDVGEHPIAHKFLQDKNASEETFPIKLGIGQRSGLVGLIDPPAWQALTPVYPWIKCNEPEDHLDNLAQELKELMPENPTILGLSDKDRTLLARFNQLGFEHTSTYQHPMLEESVCPGVEVVQAAISDAPSTEQSYDLIIGRHILEHTWQTQAFLNKVIAMLADDGLAVMEVPDNEKAFRNGQHTIIWEEHSLYFTETTLKNLLAEYGLGVAKIIRYPMALEDILVVVLKKNSPNESVSERSKTKGIDNAEMELIKSFQKRFEASKIFFREKLKAYKQQHGEIAILGAGHLGAAFVNFYGLEDLIDVVIDDDPNKQGLFMPGCKLPIVASKALNDGTYSCCLLTCNPWNNEKIASRNQEFVAKGGVFLSVFQPENWS